MNVIVRGVVGETKGKKGSGEEEERRAVWGFTFKGGHQQPATDPLHPHLPCEPHS